MLHLPSEVPAAPGRLAKIQRSREESETAILKLKFFVSLFILPFLVLT
jgi:hypothetical protein